MIPAKVGLTTFRVAHYQDEENEKQFRLSLDLINNVRMDAKQRVASYKNLMTKHYDVMIKPRQFNIGELILKRVSFDVHEIYTIKYSHIYIFSLTFMLFCD